MLNGFVILLLFQLAGELINRGLRLPIPGPVIGMVLLLSFLIWRKSVPDSLQNASEGILRHLSLLYIPAGVGLIVHLELVASDWFAILAALLVSTAVTLVVTALTLQGLRKREERNR